MAEPLLKEPPVSFKKTLISIFFKHLGNLEAVVDEIETFKGLGIKTDSFYWMYPGLEPKVSEIREMLSNPEYELSQKEIDDYCKRYEDFQRERLLPA